MHILYITLDSLILEQWTTGYCTYTVDSIDEWVVAAVAHGQPMGNEEDDVDVTIAEKEKAKVEPQILY